MFGVVSLLLCLMMLLLLVTRVISFGNKINHSFLKRTNQSSLLSASSSSSTKSSGIENVKDKHISHEQTQNTVIQKTHDHYNISKPDDINRPFFPIFYNDVYEVPLPPRHRFPMSKYRKVRERVQNKIHEFMSKNNDDEQQQQEKNPTTIQCEFRVSPLVTKEDLLTTHCENYIDRYLNGECTELELRNVGFPWSLEGVNRSLSSNGGTLAAALSLCHVKRLQQQQQQQLNCNDEDVKHIPMFSAHVAGGTHHAFKDRGEGFSVFSDIAVAANVILRDFPDIVSKILIIDLDVHQGNGNAVLFHDEKNVFTFSMHCSGNYFSPKQQSDLDIELPIGCNDETYLATLNHWLKRIKNEGGQFDLIFFQAGVDILESDRLGRMDITPKGVQRRNTMVYDFAINVGVPMVITMGGGYPKSNDWEPVLQAHEDVYYGAFDLLFSKN
mmetsp:Transcript_12732/g.15610  ORF Transcript_12732/g.15610 Transcript_12732/m.15610 type:complete len:441 (+) Transcript_12732:50-1372(+)